MAQRMDLASCQTLMRNILGGFTIVNGDLRNDFFELTRNQARQRYGNLNIAEFLTIDADPTNWRLIYDFITRKRPPNTRNNIIALDVLLREAQYDGIIQFALNEFQDHTDDRMIAFVMLIHGFTDVLPYYEEKMSLAAECTTRLENYERERARLPQFITDFYVGDVQRPAGISLSRDILQLHRDLVGSLNEYFRCTPNNSIPEIENSLAWVTRFGTNLQQAIDLDIVRVAVRQGIWQNIHLFSNRELSSLDFPVLQNLLTIDLQAIEKIGNLAEVQPPSTASVKLRGITELVGKEITKWENQPIDELTIEEVEQRTGKLNQVDRSLNDYIMTTGRDFNMINVDGSDYDVFESLATIKTQLVARKRYLEKVEKTEEQTLKNQRALINKSVPKFTLQKLKNEENFLSWIRCYEMLREQIGGEELKLLSLIKGSLDDKDDQKVTETMVSLNDVLKYLYKKYLNSSSLLHSTLKPIMNLNAPKSMAMCIKNIEEVLNIIQVLSSNGVLDQIDDSRLTRIETKCLTKQGLIEYYQAKQLARSVEAPEGDMSDLVDMTIAERMGVPRAGASSTIAPRRVADYTQMSFKQEIRRLISSESIEFKRTFFINYVEKKIEIFRSAMAAERTAETRLAEVQNSNPKPNPHKTPFKKSEKIFSAQESTSKRYDRTSRPRGPLKPCPFNCGSQHEWGSGALCTTFKNVEDVDERANIVKTFGVNKCCLKKIKHTPERPCRARLCNCGAAHHELLCKRKKKEQSIHNFRETQQDNTDDDEEEPKQDEDSEEHHNHVVESGDGVTDFPAETDYIEEEDEEEDDVEKQINGDENDVEEQINDEENDEEAQTNDEENDDNDEEAEEEESINVFSIREEDAICVLDSEVIQVEEKQDRNLPRFKDVFRRSKGNVLNETSVSKKKKVDWDSLVDDVFKEEITKLSDTMKSKSKPPESIHKYMENAKKKVKRSFSSEKVKESRPGNPRVTFAEDKDVPFSTTPVKLDWDKLLSEGVEAMKMYENTEDNRDYPDKAEIRVPGDSSILNLKPAKMKNTGKADIEKECAGSTKTLRGKHTTKNVDMETEQENQNKIRTVHHPFHDAGPHEKTTPLTRPEPWPPPDSIDLEETRKVVSRPKDENPELYQNLCKEAGVLYSLRKKNVYGMVVKIRVLIDKTKKLSNKQDLRVRKYKGNDVIEVLGMLDCGADSCVFDSELNTCFDFKVTRTQNITFHTINKSISRLVDRTKLSLMTMDDEIVNIEASNCKSMNYGTRIDKIWLAKAKEALKMKDEHMELFDFERDGPLRIIIGLKNLLHLAQKVPVETIGLNQPITSPNLGVFYSPLDCEAKFMLVGSLGLNKFLFDNNFPVFEMKKKEVSLGTGKMTVEEDPNMNDQEVNIFLTRTECNDMKIFLEEEAILSPEAKKCELHSHAIKNCNACNLMNKAKSLEDQELYNDIAKNMT